MNESCFSLVSYLFKLQSGALLVSQMVLSTIHQGREKQGNCVQGDYKHYENQTHFPKKEYFVQEYIIQGRTHTSTVIYGRNVLNKGRFVLAPAVHQQTTKLFQQHWWHLKGNYDLNSALENVARLLEQNHTGSQFHYIAPLNIIKPTCVGIYR
jgi:hypothetical protein